jgi:hypothetical protein
MVIALAKTPALTFAVGAQLVGVGAGCVPSCESAEMGLAMEDLSEMNCLHERTRWNQKSLLAKIG